MSERYDPDERFSLEMEPEDALRRLLGVEEEDDPAEDDDDS
jgi:hypothetical protein